MATYLTGRTRTLEFHGAIGGALHFQSPGILYDPAYPHMDYSVPTYYIETVFEILVSYYTGFPPYFVAVLMMNALGASYGSTFPYTIPSEGDFKLDWDCTGTWSITAPVEEVIEIDYGSYPSGNVGTQLIDPPAPCSIKIYEQLVLGGYVTISVEAGNLISGGGSTLITTSNIIPLIYGGSVWSAYQIVADVTAESNAGYPATASLTTLLNNLPLGAPGISGGSANKTWDATAGAAATCITTDLILNDIAATSLTALPPREIIMNGVINAMGRPYPEDIKVVAYQYLSSPGLVVDASGGSYSSSYTQRVYAASNYAGPLVSYNDASPVSANVQAASLTTNGEDDTLTRLLGRGFKWNAMTMTQAASMNVDDAPQTTNWTAGSNTTLADSGSDEITATVSGGLGSLSSTLPIADSQPQARRLGRGLILRVPIPESDADRGR